MHVHVAGLACYIISQVILSIGITWIICLILTAVGVFSTDPSNPSGGASTNNRIDVFYEAPWFRVPYPGQCKKLQE